MSKDKRVLITGASGFIGTALVSVLLDHNIPITATYRENKNLIIDDPLCKKFKHDLNTKNYDKIFENVDTVVHLAGCAHEVGETDHKKLHESNVLGTEKIVRSAIKNRVQKFIYLSSIKVNGEYNLVGNDKNRKAFFETDIPRPEDSYARSKYEAESIIINECEKSSMEYVVLRPALVYGPGVKANFLSFLSFILENKYPLPIGGCKEKRSFLFVGNLVDVIYKCIKSSAVNNQIYLVNDINMSVCSLAKIIAKIEGKKILIFSLPVFLLKYIAMIINKEKIFNKLIMPTVIDNSKLCNDLSWRPVHSFEDSVLATINWYKNEYLNDFVK